MLNMAYKSQIEKINQMKKELSVLDSQIKKSQKKFEKNTQNTQIAHYKHVINSMNLLKKYGEKLINVTELNELKSLSDLQTVPTDNAALNKLEESLTALKKYYKEVLDFHKTLNLTCENISQYTKNYKKTIDVYKDSKYSSFNNSEKKSFSAFELALDRQKKKLLMPLTIKSAQKQLSKSSHTTILKEIKTLCIQFSTLPEDSLGVFKKFMELKKEKLKQKDLRNKKLSSNEIVKHLNGYLKKLESSKNVVALISHYKTAVIPKINEYISCVKSFNEKHVKIKKANLQKAREFTMKQHFHSKKVNLTKDPFFRIMRDMHNNGLNDERFLQLVKILIRQACSPSFFLLPFFILSIVVTIFSSIIQPYVVISERQASKQKLNQAQENLTNALGKIPKEFKNKHVQPTQKKLNKQAQLMSVECIKKIIEDHKKVFCSQKKYLKEQKIAKNEENKLYLTCIKKLNKFFQPQLKSFGCFSSWKHEGSLITFTMPILRISKSKKIHLKTKLKEIKKQLKQFKFIGKLNITNDKILFEIHQNNLHLLRNLTEPLKRTNNFPLANFEYKQPKKRVVKKSLKKDNPSTVTISSSHHIPNSDNNKKTLKTATSKKPSSTKTNKQVTIYDNSNDNPHAPLRILIEKRKRGGGMTTRFFTRKNNQLTTELSLEDFKLIETSLQRYETAFNVVMLCNELGENFMEVRNSIFHHYSVINFIRLQKTACEIVKGVKPEKLDILYDCPKHAVNIIYSAVKSTIEKLFIELPNQKDDKLIDLKKEIIKSKTQLKIKLGSTYGEIQKIIAEKVKNIYIKHPSYKYCHSLFPKFFEKITTKINEEPDYVQKASGTPTLKTLITDLKNCGKNNKVKAMILSLIGIVVRETKFHKSNWYSECNKIRHEKDYWKKCELDKLAENVINDIGALTMKCNM